MVLSKALLGTLSIILEALPFIMFKDDMVGAGGGGGGWTGTNKYSENIKALFSTLAERNISFLRQYTF